MKDTIAMTKDEFLDEVRALKFTVTKWSLCNYTYSYLAWLGKDVAKVRGGDVKVYGVGDMSFERFIENHAKIESERTARLFELVEELRRNKSLLMRGLFSRDEDNYCGDDWYISDDYEHALKEWQKESV